MKANDRALRSSQSPVQILADAIGACLPTFVWSAAIQLPTATFEVLRTGKHLANQLGKQIVQEKAVATERQGLRTEIDIYDMLREFSYHAPQPVVLMRHTSVDQGHSDKRGNALSEEEIVSQTGIILFGGQDTTVSIYTSLMQRQLLMYLMRRQSHWLPDCWNSPEIQKSKRNCGKRSSPILQLVPTPLCTTLCHC